MPEAGFHLEQPGWLWLLLALLPVAIWLWRSAARAARGPVHRYADPQLLPYLTGTRELGTGERWGQFLSWSLLWALLVLAMAGPRWDYEERRLFQAGDNLLVLLDISRSMEVDDVAPSRLARARQEIADLLRLNREVRLGLIAFASVPHVISPVSEDPAAIRNSLPALSTDLTQLPGSRLLAALDRAEMLLANLPHEGARSILLISDGDFAEPGLTSRVAQLAKQGIQLHTLGIGTVPGGLVPGPRGARLLDRTGEPVRSALDEPLLQALAGAGQGQYWQATYRDDDTRAILKAAAASALPPTMTGERARIWNDRYYIPVIIAAILLVFTRFLPRARGRRSAVSP